MQILESNWDPLAKSKRLGLRLGDFHGLWFLTHFGHKSWKKNWLGYVTSQRFLLLEGENDLQDDNLSNSSSLFGLCFMLQNVA